MRYAETGYNLEIDLTRGNIERVETDPRLTELHLGGLGTNAKILWDRVPPETEPFSLIIYSYSARSFGRHTCSGRESYRCHYLFSSDFVNGIFNDGDFLHQN